MEKKGQGRVITIVLIILIILVIMVIVWNVVIPLVRERSEEIDLTGFTTNLEITEVIVFENGVSHVKVNRKAGGQVDGLRFVFYDETGNAITRDEQGLGELETKKYYFSSLEDLGEIKSVSVAPIVNGKIGIESEEKTSEILKLPSGLISWWRFNESRDDLVNGNNCVLSGENYDCKNSGSLSFNEEMAISFWVEDNLNATDLIEKGENYKISLNNNLVGFSDSDESERALNELGQGWNHIVVTIDFDGISNIYTNTNPDNIEINTSLTNTNDLIISNKVDSLMIFNKSLSSFDVNGLYTYQKSYFE